MENSFVVGQFIYRNGGLRNDQLQFVVIEKISDDCYKLLAVGNAFASLADIAGKGVEIENDTIIFPRTEKLPEFVRYQWFRDEVIYITNKFDNRQMPNKYWQAVELNEHGKPSLHPCNWRPWDVFMSAQEGKPACVVS